MEQIARHQPQTRSEAPFAPALPGSTVLGEAVVCLLDCSFGAAAGIAVSIVLDWAAAAGGALALAGALAWCLAGVDCAFMRRGIRVWKQHG